MRSDLPDQYETASCAPAIVRPTYVPWSVCVCWSEPFEMLVCTCMHSRGFQEPLSDAPREGARCLGSLMFQLSAFGPSNNEYQLSLTGPRDCIVL